MERSIFHQKMEKRTQTDHWLRRTYLSAQLGPAISRLVLHTRAIVEERLVYNNTWINKKPKVQHSHARKWQSTYNINNKIVKPSSVSLYNKNISILRTSIQAKKLIKEDWLKQWQKISSLAPKYHKYHTNRTMIQQAYHGHGIQSSEQLYQSTNQYNSTVCSVLNSSWICQGNRNTRKRKLNSVSSITWVTISWVNQSWSNHISS